MIKRHDKRQGSKSSVKKIERKYKNIMNKTFL